MNHIKAVDLDDVLFETMDAFLAFHKYNIGGVHVTREDITDYHLYRIKDLKLDCAQNQQLWNTFNLSGQPLHIKPVIGAKEVLDKYIAQGNKIFAITGRSESIKGFTHASLEKHYQDIISDVFFLNAYADLSSPKVTQRTKSEICKEIGAQVMVEDDLHYAEELAANGIKVYLLDQPRNTQHQNGMHPNIIKVASRQEIAKYEHL